MTATSGQRLSLLGELFLRLAANNGLTLEKISQQTSLSPEDIQGLTIAEKRFDAEIIEKLQAVFPTSANVFRKMQNTADEFIGQQLSRVPANSDLAP